MMTYREREAMLDNEVAEYKFEMAQRLGPPEPRYTGEPPRARSGLEHTCDTPETDLEACSRCGEVFEAVDLEAEGFCAYCHEQTWHERDQEMEMNREEYS